MIIKSADFISSSSEYQQCPPPDKPEIAFIGRSNVGKSSLINMLANRKKLAKTSSTPGKTLLINHFTVNDRLYWVDLPGYGWAKVSKKKREELEKMIQHYLLYRKNLYIVLVLIDSRHDPQPIDLEFIRWLGVNQIPFAIVFTKVDKQGKTMTEKSIARFKKALMKEWEQLPAFYRTSSFDKTGKEDLLEFMSKIK